MFKHTRELNILPAIAGHINDTELLRGISELCSGEAAADLVCNFREDVILPLIQKSVIRDLNEMGMADHIPFILETDEDIGFIESWNMFMCVDGGDREAKDHAELSGVIVAMIESELLHIAYPMGLGPATPHHIEPILNHDKAQRRITEAEANLKAALRAGTSRSDYVAHRTDRENPGQARILLDAGRPVLELRPDGQAEWKRAEIRDVDLTPKPSEPTEFDM